MTGIGASEGVSIGKVLLFITEEIVVPKLRMKIQQLKLNLQNWKMD